MEIDHIAVAVHDLNEAIERFSALLGIEPFGQQDVESEGVAIAFFAATKTSTKLELLAPLSDSSTLYTFLQKRGEGMHHIAYRSHNIEEDAKRWAALGYRQIGEIRRAYGDHRACFFHPRELHGVLVELVS